MDDGSARYEVSTWDVDREMFSPQEGVPIGPYTLFGLRVPLRLLRAMGYSGSRGDPSVLVERTSD